MAEKQILIKAVIDIKGHQYLVHPSMKLRVNRMSETDGSAVEFKDVLCVVQGETAKIGKPVVAGAVVRAKIVGAVSGKKVIAFKYRPKARSRVKKGFRASETEIEITDIKA